MRGIVSYMAPRGWVDGAIKLASTLCLITSFSLLVQVTLFGALVGSFVHIALLTAIVSLPFMLFTFMVTRYLYLLQKSLAELATTDVLTGLPNRRAFLNAVSQLDAQGETGALLLLDADYFKSINDTYGHSVGDECLRAIGRHLRRVLEDEKIVGRYGGEEFAVFLPSSSLAEAREIGERLSQAIEVPTKTVLQHAAHAPQELGSTGTLGSGTIVLTLSVGGAMPEAGQSLNQQFYCADKALYRAKAQGRARLVIYESIWDSGGLSDIGMQA
ncbi:GGDEF domain-containing protein [Litorivita sp. NS0012-18]|uniref:GGDEF domain-containing protein n=1 Tax=Litorivita sp. NS0012-18 TaxID=3127655 RepID=UPI003101B75B